MTISPFTANAVLFLLGALFGIYLPGVCLYILLKWKSHPSWQALVWSLTKKILMAVFGLLVVSATLGFVLAEVLKMPGPLPESSLMWLGFGTLLGLAVGLWTIQKVLRRRRHVASQSGEH